jgi:LytS/YehU family sensor histidine kinase
VVLLAAVMYFLRIPGSILLDMFLPEVIFSAGNIVGLSSVYVFIFFMWSVLYFVYNYFERYNNSLKLEASLKEIELNNLKSQLNPHFIFNALNSIRALVDENPGKSKQAITQLSGMLRSSLTSGREKLTPLKEEIRLVQDYLGLEMIRFEERLRPHYDIDPATENLMVPPLMIQTLVENGIKHGISKLTHGGSIEIGSKILNSDLRIWIRNTGSFKENEKNSGTGLANTRQRLMLLYGDRANLTILEEGNFVLTEIIIPL